MDPQRRRLTVGQVGKGAASEKFTNDLAKSLAEKDPKIICVHSITDCEMKKKESFGEKDRAAWKDKLLGEERFTTVTPNVNYTCKKGLKPESPNQDSFAVVIQPGKWGLYGVFDGHGPNGHDVSDFAVKTLVTLFLDMDDFATNTGPCFTKAFTECQKTIEAAKSVGLDSSSSGSTCTMAFHNLETDVLTIGHVGDSRAVVYEGNEMPMPVLKETEDHKPNLPGEKARIEKMGGRVVFDGYYNYRVFAKAGMYPGLNMSRALGDVVAHKEAGLTAEPELNIVELKGKRGGKPLTLIIASDGVWEFIKSEEAPKELIVSGNKIENEQKKIEALAKKSWDSWMEDSDNEISDDITVICITL